MFWSVLKMLLMKKAHLWTLLIFLSKNVKCLVFFTSLATAACHDFAKSTFELNRWISLLQNFQKQNVNFRLLWLIDSMFTCLNIDCFKTPIISFNIHKWPIHKEKNCTNCFSILFFSCICSFINNLELENVPNLPSLKFGLQ